ncbi:MAG: hypothetical protein M1823_003324 [Watsoniomyces obsoletus]|nr:MAG: hypothetical protein M1823_003324 [Watsoniomyces obsoletus]
MAEIPTSIRVAQTLGITTSAILSGAIAWTSYAFVPALLQAPPSTLVQQWQQVYDTGKATAPPTALLVFASWAYVAYRHAQQPLASISGKWTSYAVASVSAIAIVPYTLLVMADTNRKLYAKANEARLLGSSTTDEVTTEQERKSVKQLLDRWATLNVVRAVFPLITAVVGTWTALGY